MKRKNTAGTDNAPHILLVNPWIHDFAAYDFWARPMGLLMLGGLLRQHGIPVSYIDCLDRFHPKSAGRPSARRCGRGPYLKTPIAKPRGLEDVPRTYSRYGIKKEWFIRDLEVQRPPDLVLVTSLMTYWYPGVKETISAVRSVFPDAPVVLGGIYATLCTAHAENNAGADAVIPGSGLHSLFEVVRNFTGYSATLRYDPDDLSTCPMPALDLQNTIPFAPLLTSLGCPFHCAYCASGVLNPEIKHRRPRQVVEEIAHWHGGWGVREFAFYDDALLVQPDWHIIPMLNGVVSAGLKVRFHTPNALHARHITRDTANLMARSGFHTIRLGLETASFGAGFRHLDRKLTQNEFLDAIFHLKNAGFHGSQVGAYLLTGLPGQSPADVKEAIDFVKDCGITPILAHYTPIPRTPMWAQAVASSRYDLNADPLFTNNAVSPCRKTAFSWKDLSRLKNRCTA